MAKKPLIKFHHFKDGEGMVIENNHFWFSCCDCDLRHHAVLQIVGKELVVRMYRDDLSTNLIRKLKKKKLM